MEIQHLFKQFVYRIESKPEGGFIARATDPTLPPLEAATRIELQQKIQAKIATDLASAFPALKLPTDGSKANLSFHIEHKPDGSYAIHSADPNVPSIDGATHEDIQTKFAEKLLNLAGNSLLPEFGKVLDAKGSGEIKVVINKTTGFTSKTSSHTFSFGGGTPTQVQSPDPKIIDAPANQTSNSSPIIPESYGGVGSIVRFVLALLIVGGLVYFYLHRH